MSDESSPPRVPDPDPEIEALLHFEPVMRHTRRHDGWSPERQYGFIAALARLGDVDRASHSVGRTASGAWKVRSSAGAEGFSDSWDAALDLFHERNPLLSRRGGRAVPGARGGPPPAPDPAPPQEPERDLDGEWEEFSDGILTAYLLKLAAEREARLEGRIVEADFLVRQLTWVEVALDLSGVAPKAVEMLKGLQRGGCHAGRITATPMSILLAELRRAAWAKLDEPERPDPAPLGHHDDDFATGQPPESQHWPERDGDRFQARDKRDQYLRRNAEAQRAWEKKAEADAQAWRERLSADNYPLDAEDEAQ